jgi:hypothetical protein
MCDVNSGGELGGARRANPPRKKNVLKEYQMVFRENHLVIV